jgi:peptidyl-prolyl cis-trans isomerase D
MSVLESIRNKSGLVIAVVGGALALFVISDALNSNSRLFSGQNPNELGEINGEQISFKQFEAKVEETVRIHKMNSRQENIDQATMDGLRDQAWNQLLQEQMLGREYEELGIKVTDDELFDLVQGDEPHAQIKSAPIFQNPQTGQYDKSLVIRFLKDMQQRDEASQAQWAQFEEGIYKETLSRKYVSLLKKGVYATTLEARNKMNERMRTMDLDMVAVNYFSIPDSTIAEDDGELKSYFRKNSDKYKEKEDSRKIEFVMFDVYPSSEDSASIRKWVEDQMAGFAAAKNDTLYVDLNSDTKFDTTAKRISAFPADIQDQIFNAAPGTIVGPVYRDGKYSIYKIAGTKQDTVYQMRASHILFKTENNDTLATIKKAQGVMAEIRKGASFAEKAAQYGTDGTASQGGDLGWFTEGQMVKEFNDAVLNGRKGDMMIVKTQFGIHIVKITEDKTRKLITAGVLERKIEPGEKTTNLLYTQAGQFAGSSQSTEDFNHNIEEKNYTKRTADNIRELDKSIAGLPDAREVVRWAFNAKTGDVSDVFAVGDKYIVAHLAAIREKDKADFETSRDRVLVDYRKDKKAEMLMEKAKSAMEGATTLEAIATKVQAAVTPVTGQSFENANIAYIGMDNTIAGTIYGTTTLNKILGPVKGDQAVYMYSVKKINNPENTTDVTMYRSEVISQLASKLEYGTMEALKEMNHVKDNRAKFY